jgi:hypothetical protein
VKCKKIPWLSVVCERLGPTVFCLFIVIVISLPKIAQAYDPEVHYAWTYYLALKLGYTEREAFQIASGSTAFDEDYDTAPHLQATAGDAIFGAEHEGPLGIGEKNPEIARIWSLYHAFAPENMTSEEADKYRERIKDELWKLAVEQRNPGPYLHFVQDIYSHGEYTNTRGHIVAGNSIDYMSYKPDITRALTDGTIEVLQQFNREVMGREPRELNRIQIWDAMHKMIEANPIPELMAIPNTERAIRAINAVILEEIANGYLPSSATNLELPLEWFEYDFDRDARVDHPYYYVGRGLRPGELRVRVLDAETKMPLPQARIVVTFRTRDKPLASEFAQADGVYIFHELPGREDTYRVRVTLKGYQPADELVEILFEGAGRLTVFLEPEAPVIEPGLHWVLVPSESKPNPKAIWTERPSGIKTGPNYYLETREFNEGSAWYKNTWSRSEGGELFSEYKFDYTYSAPPSTLQADTPVSLKLKTTVKKTGSRYMNSGVGYGGEDVEISDKCMATAGSITGKGFVESATKGCTLTVPAGAPDKIIVFAYIGGQGIAMEWVYRKKQP